MKGRGAMYHGDGSHTWIGMILIGLSTLTSAQMIYVVFAWLL